jgi:hypothetical protein
VVDPSVVIDWIAPGADPKSPSMETLRGLIRSNEQVLAPELLFVECANALVAGVRRRRWTGVAADVSICSATNPIHVPAPDLTLG